VRQVSYLQESYQDAGQQNIKKKYTYICICMCVCACVRVRAHKTIYLFM